MFIRKPNLAFLRVLVKMRTISLQNYLIGTGPMLRLLIHLLHVVSPALL